MDKVILILLIYNILFGLINIILFVKNYLRYRKLYYKIEYDNKYGNIKKKEKVTINDKVCEVLFDNGTCLYVKEIKTNKKE